MNYEEWLLDKALPNWIVGEWGRKWFGVFASVADIAKNATKDAVKARFVKTAPDDAIPFIADDSLIERGRLESLGPFKLRLADRWDTHQLGGTANGVVASLAAVHVDPIYTYALGPHDGFNGDGKPYWSRFWVVFDGAHGFTQETWGSGGTWDYGAVWGISNATPEDIQQLKRLIWFWKSGHSVPVELFILFSDEIWAPTDRWADGNWTAAPNYIHFRLGNFWALEEHNYGNGPYGSDGGWGDPGNWGCKPEDIA